MSLLFYEWWYENNIIKLQKFSLFLYYYKLKRKEYIIVYGLLKEIMLFVIFLKRTIVKGELLYLAKFHYSNIDFY